MVQGTPDGPSLYRVQVTIMLLPFQQPIARVSMFSEVSVQDTGLRVGRMRLGNSLGRKHVIARSRPILSDSLRIVSP